MAAPHGFHDPYLGAVVVFPHEPSELPFACPGISRRGDDRRGGIRKDRQHQRFFLKRVCVSLSPRTSLGDFDIVHGIGVVQDPLTARVPKYAAQEVLDVAERRATQILTTSDGPANGGNGRPYLPSALSLGS